MAAFNSSVPRQPYSSNMYLMRGGKIICPSPTPILVIPAARGRRLVKYSWVGKTAANAAEPTPQPVIKRWYRYIMPTLNTDQCPPVQYVRVYRPQSLTLFPCWSRHWTRYHVGTSSLSVFLLNLELITLHQQWLIILSFHQLVKGNNTVTNQCCRSVQLR